MTMASVHRAVVLPSSRSVDRLTDAVDLGSSTLPYLDRCASEAALTPELPACGLL